LLCALVLVGLCSGAQAAYFERVDYLGSGGYSATTNGVSVSDAALDFSPASGDVALLGANTFNASLTNGSLAHSYAADAYLTFSTSQHRLVDESQPVAGRYGQQRCTERCRAISRTRSSTCRQ